MDSKQAPNFCAGFVLPTPHYVPPPHQKPSDRHSNWGHKQMAPKLNLAPNRCQGCVCWVWRCFRYPNRYPNRTCFRLAAKLSALSESSSARGWESHAKRERSLQGAGAKPGCNGARDPPTPPSRRAWARGAPGDLGGPLLTQALQPRFVQQALATEGAAGSGREGARCQLMPMQCPRPLLHLHRLLLAAFALTLKRRAENSDRGNHPGQTQASSGAGGGPPHLSACPPPARLLV